MNTTKIFKKIAFLLISAAIISIVSVSCEDDSNEDIKPHGDPIIYYVRSTDPAKSDSLYAGSYLGDLIAIIGDNLGGTKEIWFNDLKAQVIPTYVTNKAILVNVPSTTPTNVNNLLTLINKDSVLTTYEFVVEIPEPELLAMKSEYVADGGSAVLQGQYFYEPLTVTFPGGIEGEVESVTETEIKVKVPEGSTEGTITVTTNFGTVESTFFFRDSRNLIITSDPFTGWWREEIVTDGSGEGDPTPINGNFIRAKTQNPGVNHWWEIAGGPPDATGDVTKNIPDDAIKSPQKYSMKMEINTLKQPGSMGALWVTLGTTAAEFDNFDIAYPISSFPDTNGDWQTISIPMSAILDKHGTTPNPAGYWLRFWFWGHAPYEGALDIDIAFDNIRVVPN